MIELFLKLMEKLVELAREKKKANRSLHDDFVLPLMKQYEELHNQYVSTFQEYGSLINAELPEFTVNNHVFAKIKSDILWSHTNREKLWAMSSPLINSQASLRSLAPPNDKLERFIYHLYHYIISVHDMAEESEMSNIQRYGLLESLKIIADNQNLSLRQIDFSHNSLEGLEKMTLKQEAENQVLQRIEEMQRHYRNIQKAYQEAKLDLLS